MDQLIRGDLIYFHHGMLQRSKASMSARYTNTAFCAQPSEACQFNLTILKKNSILYRLRNMTNFLTVFLLLLFYIAISLD